MSIRACAFSIIAAYACLAPPDCASAQAAPRDSQRVSIMAVVDSALTAINGNDLVALATLMVPEAQMYAVGGGRNRAGYSVRSAAELRTQTQRGRIIERGFDGDVRVAGAMAVVWLPYDIYVNEAWSHCGVDVFTLLRVDTAWRIANLTYSVEQPPACRAHPAGPPPGITRSSPPR